MTHTFTFKKKLVAAVMMTKLQPLQLLTTFLHLHVACPLLCFTYIVSSLCNNSARYYYPSFPEEAMRSQKSESLAPGTGAFTTPHCSPFFSENSGPPRPLHPWEHPGRIKAQVFWEHQGRSLREEMELSYSKWKLHTLG